KHKLPERIAHKGKKIQFELVAVLALISLFTQNHIFRIAGLLLAFIPFPDFSPPLTGMNSFFARRRSCCPGIKGVVLKFPLSKQMATLLHASAVGASASSKNGKF